MGVTIHYRGSIGELSEVDHIIDELKDFASTLNWEIQLWDEDWSGANTATILVKGEELHIGGHIPLRGIVLFPHENCEPLFLTFSSEGHLIDSINMALLAENKYSVDDLWQRTKTQFSPIETHIAIIKLLKYLKKRYIADLEVYDDGGYWETGDQQLLEKRMRSNSESMESIASSLIQIPAGILENKTANEIADFIDELIRQKFWD